MEPKEFGSFIQNRRKALGMNQAELAEKLHVTAKAVSRWERGVGFPDIKLLQPLADALEITIAELMQSRLQEKDLPKEEAAQLVSQTVDTIRQKEALNWKRKLILYGGYAVLFAMYAFLYLVGRETPFEPRWIGLVVIYIGLFLWHYGSRALYCILTGEPFFEKRQKKKWQYYAANVFLVLGVLILVGGLLWIESKGLRGWICITGLMMAFVSGLYLSFFNEELNQ